MVELNPAAVKEARAQQLLRRLKSDARDIGAMAELMVHGGGRAPAMRTDASRPRRHGSRTGAARFRPGSVANQVIGELDLVFPGWTGASRICSGQGGPGDCLRHL